MKKPYLIGGGIVILIVIIIIASMSSSSAKAVSKKENEITVLQDELKAKQGIIEEKDTEIVELNERIEEAKPWFELKEKERKEKIEQAEAKEKAKKVAEEKKAAAAKKEAEKVAAEKAAKEAAAEAEAKKKAEAEAKKGYDTGITFNQLARTPDKYEGEKVKFRGKVIQVIEGDGETQIRFAVNDNYDTILFAAFESDIVESRVLEDDVITIMGISNGLLSYESTNGGNITIPSVLIDKIDQ
ncbi:toxin regulator [Sporosarcina sp. G11-34]|nr:toxin regulator [Sporosarcina sp. G11-34]